MKEFGSLRAFSRHLQGLAATGPAVTNHLGHEAGEVVKAAAHAKFGEYQDGVGGWPAWANLAERTVEERLRLGFTPDDPLLRSGELRDSVTISQDGETTVVGSANSVMLWQETGTDRGIPPRPVLGPAAFESRPKWSLAIAAGVAAWVAGLNWRHDPLKLLGESEKR